VGVAGRLGQAKAAASAKDYGCGLFQTHTMPGGYEHRPYPGACSDHGADDFILILERAPGASLGRRLVKGTAQTGLGAPDRWAIEQQAQMARQAEPARVRKSLSVKEQYIGKGGQSGQGIKHYGRLPEGEETGHIGIGHGSLGGMLLDTR